MPVNVKESALEAIRRLPDDCTWRDIEYLMHVRRKIQEGLDDIEAGRVVSHDEVFRAYKE
jgi:predicted transcriptional regulator